MFNTINKSSNWQITRTTLLEAPTYAPLFLGYTGINAHDHFFNASHGPNYRIFAYNFPSLTKWINFFTLNKAQQINDFAVRIDVCRKKYSVLRFGYFVPNIVSWWGQLHQFIEEWCTWVFRYIAEHCDFPFQITEQWTSNDRYFYLSIFLDSFALDNNNAQISTYLSVPFTDNLCGFPLEAFAVDGPLKDNRMHLYTSYIDFKNVMLFDGKYPKPALEVHCKSTGSIIRLMWTQQMQKNRKANKSHSLEAPTKVH